MSDLCKLRNLAGVSGEPHHNNLMNFETARTQMLGQQIRAWDVLDDRVLGVFRDTPREFFVPQEYRDLAFADTEIPLGHGQVMMAPKIEGRLLQALNITPIDTVLEVGTGSGYLSACLARLAQTVLSVDVHAEFTADAGAKLAELGIENVEIANQDALTMQEPARFDVVAVTASVPTLDDHFARMLKPRGRLFIVVGRPPIMEAKLVTMHPDGQWTEDSLFETLLTPLENLQHEAPFLL